MTAGDTQTTATAEHLWDALRQARAGHQPRTLAHVEDALFRSYLPMARSMVAQHAADHPDPDGLRQAAEVGLAQAILGWRPSGPGGFDRFARSTITTQLRRHDTLTRRARRPRPGSRLPTTRAPDPTGPTSPRSSPVPAFHPNTPRAAEEPPANERRP